MTHGMDLADTIAAPASAPGGAMRGIIRISGSETWSVISRLVDEQLAVPSSASVLDLQIELTVPELPPFQLPVQAWVWPDSRSFTREQLVELHFLGSPPLAELLLQRVLAVGARLAKPGEFTLRAFLAGRIDLLQAEAVLGVIDAQDQATLKTSLSQLAGGLSQPLANLQQDLLNLLADLEAGLDFVDEDISFISSAELFERLNAAQLTIQQIAQQMQLRQTGEERPRVVLIGLPNAGKSQLFNRLTKQTTALVSPVAGTTRDYLRAELNWDGVSFELIDTAGIMQGRGVNTASPDDLAQMQTNLQLSRAALALYCIDVNQFDSAMQNDLSPNIDTLIVLTKADSGDPLTVSNGYLLTSSLTGYGIEQLCATIVEKLRNQSANGVASTVIRCHKSLAAAQAAIAQALGHLERQSSEEWVAADVRAALNEIGEMVGTIYTNDLLDRIFSRFCIGK